MFLSCSPQPVTKQEIITFIDRFEEEYEYLNRRIAEIEWSLNTGRSDSPTMRDSLNLYRDALKQLTGNPESLPTIKSYLSMVDDGDRSKKLEIIYRICRKSVINSDPEINRDIEALQRKYRDFTPIFEGESYNYNSLRQLLSREENRQRRRNIWAALQSSGEAHAEELVSVIRKRNHLVSQLGYNSYYDLMLLTDEIDEKQLDRFIEELDRLSREPYKNAIDSLARELGLENIRAWDIEFALGRVDYRLDDYYPADNQRDLLQTTLAGIDFKIQSLPIYFADSDQSAQVTDRNLYAINIPDDIRIYYDPQKGRESFRSFFGLAGKALYRVHIDPDGYLMTMPPSPCFEEAMGKIISGLTQLRAWKRKYAGMPEPLSIEASADRDVRRLYRLRQSLLKIAFERTMYDNPFADMQEIYATLYEKYMMFPLEVSLYGWAADNDYLVKPVSCQNELIADCLAAQTFAYLNDKYGSVLDNEHTREFLVQNYFRFGGRDHWQTLLERGTGEKLTAKYYFGFLFD